MLLWTLCFGFVSGHDFSRAIRTERELGFSPCLLLRGKARDRMRKKRAK